MPRGGCDEAQRDALTKANEFCVQQGRQFVPNNMGQAGNLANPYGPTGYAATFKCLLPNDPAIARYQLQQAPNVIIEQRNRKLFDCFPENPDLGNECQSEQNRSNVGKPSPVNDGVCQPQVEEAR